MADTLILPVGIGKPTLLTHNFAVIDCLLGAPSCPSYESTQCDCGAFERADFVMGPPRRFLIGPHVCCWNPTREMCAVVDDDAPFVYPMRPDILRFGRF
jgi:hypothetical protein